jgi:hypothetical protein
VPAAAEPLSAARFTLSIRTSIDVSNAQIAVVGSSEWGGRAISVMPFAGVSGGGRSLRRGLISPSGSSSKGGQALDCGDDIARAPTFWPVAFLSRDWPTAEPPIAEKYG